MRLSLFLVVGLLGGTPSCSQGVVPAQVAPAPPLPVTCAEAARPHADAEEHGELPFAEMEPDDRSLFDERGPRNAEPTEAHSSH